MTFIWRRRKKNPTPSPQTTASKRTEEAGPPSRPAQEDNRNSLLMNIDTIVNSNRFKNFIITVIIINAIVLGLHTVKNLDPAIIHFFDAVDYVCLAIFILEILMKLSVQRWHFFKSGWNVFDFLIVAIALLPSEGGLSVLRAFRIFRVMRLISTIHSMRRIVQGMIEAIPGVGSVGGLLLIVFYIGAVMTTNLFGADFPEWFGDLGKSMYTLFQVMTLESWSMGIVRPIMEVYPYSWLFFIPFITVTTFTVLNLFIGIVIDAMALVKEEEQKGTESTKIEQILEKNVDEIRTRLTNIEQHLQQKGQKGHPS